MKNKKYKTVQTCKENLDLFWVYKYNDIFYFTLEILFLIFDFVFFKKEKKLKQSKKKYEIVTKKIQLSH